MRINYLFTCLLLVIWLTAHTTGVAQFESDQIRQSYKVAFFDADPAASPSVPSKAKYVVFNFWATWCGPCVAEFPQLVKIQQEYKDRVKIVCVTDQRTALVNSFLKGRYSDLHFMSDTTRAFFKMFNVDAIPINALFTSPGKLVWGGSLANLETALPNLLQTGTLDQGTLETDEMAGKYFGNHKKSIEPLKLLDYSIARSKIDDTYFAQTQKDVNKPVSIRYTAVPLNELIEDFTNTPFTRIRYLREGLDTILINLTAKTNSPGITYQKFSSRILEDIQTMFGFSIMRQPEFVTVSQISSSGNGELKKYLEPSAGGGSISRENGVFVLTRISLENLASFVEGKLNEIVLVKAGPEKYTFTIPAFKTIAELKTHLQAKGIAVESIRTKIDFTIIR